MSNEHSMNSREWWEDYFALQWDANGGTEQTRHFMESLVANLPDPEVRYLLENPASVLDWGCAFGEGVVVLATAFPQTRVAGLDHASNAIETARFRHPGNEFILSPDGEIPGEFDVIITSNCLEHFRDPMPLVANHLKRCRQFYAALVPYDEKDLFEQHLYRFTEDSFAERIDRFVRCDVKAIDVCDAYWPGRQLLVIYGSPEYVARRAGEASQGHAIEQWRQFYQRLMVQSAHQGCGSIYRREQTIKELRSQNAERKAAASKAAAELAEQAQRTETVAAELAEQKLTSEKLVTQVSLLSEQVEDAGRRVDDAGRRVEELTGRLLEKENELLSSQEAASALRSERDFAVLRGRTLSIELSAKADELARIRSSVGWKLLSFYGWLKYRYLLPVYRMLRLPPYGTAVQRAQALPTASEPGGSETASSPLAGLNDSNAFDVICFPIIEWDFRFQRPQQLMGRFAAAGHRVFYVSQKFYSDGDPYVIERKADNIYEVRFRGPHLNVYTDAIDVEARESFLPALSAMRRDMRLGASLAIVQLPFWWPLARETRTSFGWPVVYDCMDDHSGFSTNSRRMVEHEGELMASADLVIASSLLLEAKARACNPNTVLVRNACDYDHFSATKASKASRPTVGYYGAIADWFDSEMVADLAQSRPDWDFILVGSTLGASTGHLSRLANVTLAGERPYLEIPDWLGRFDVAIIPFKRGPLTEATSPVKAYEILAAGKPLVSVPIPEMTALDGLVRLASSAEEFEHEIAEALEETDPTLVERRKSFAREHTWEARYQDLAPRIRDAFPKATVIVVTFNNVELNRLCLESIYGRTEWPNFDVIVVDNGSTDGTREYLEGAARVFPNLRLILNDTNLGFAAANNLGLKDAKGDYLVLLNNDTVVTRGWLSSLIRHLIAKPDIGLIGPVSNAIGNEAKVEVEYASLDEMPAWGAEYVRRHDSETFAIPMLAMFCVVMRREVFEEVGELDERFTVGMFEDDDYCRRVRQKGYDLRCARDSFIHHWQRASFLLLGEPEYIRIYKENRRKYKQKWGIEKSPAAVHVDNPAADGMGGARNSKHGALPEKRTDTAVRELDRLLDEIEAAKGAVIFPPSIGWRINLVQRPHHLARQFARDGYVSIFQTTSGDAPEGVTRLEPNLFLFGGDDHTQLKLIDRPILWTLPYNFHQADEFDEAAIKVYDWIDDLDVFPHERALLDRNHARAMREADVVTTVARNLHQQAVDLRPDALYLPNGVEYERFAADDPASPDDSDWKRLLDQRKPIAGYYGALARWFDYRMLEAAAVQRQDWNFVLIGQSLDDSLDEQTLLRQPNVFWLGPRQYESLPGYLRDFDVALIPFVINRITQATSPLKLYEYLAAGKPVIATAMPECESVPDVRIAHDSTELARALDAARSQGCDDQFKERVRNFASQHSWSSRAAQVTQSIGVILRLGAERANLTDRNDLNAKPPATDPAGHESTQAAAKLKT